jgi:hypothetical protein
MQQIQKTVCGQAKWNVAGTRPCSECERSSFASSNKSIIFYGRGGRGLPLEFADLTPLFAIGGFVFAGRSPSVMLYFLRSGLEPYLRPSLSTNAVILHVSVGKRTTEFATACLPSGR